MFYRDLRDVGFFFKDFIYLFMWQPISERGNRSRGVGEEEAGSQWRSPMRDSFPECRDHAFSGRQALNDCATQAPRVVGFLIFQPAFCVLGEGPAAPILRQPCLGRVSASPARGDGDGHTVSRYFQAFVLWWLSLVVCCAFSERQSSSGLISASVTEQRGSWAILH